MFFSKVLLGLASVASLTTATSLEERTSSSSSSYSSSFTCPPSMSYCSWTRSCSCPPGQSYSSKKSSCTGTALTGAWPKPPASAYGSVHADLAAFCACSPYEIVPYDASHAYCKASLTNVVFLAPVEITAEVKLRAGASIDVSSCSKALKHTCAGLSGLYLSSASNAAALFNTGTYGLSVTSSSVVDAFAVGILDKIKGLTCWLGLTQCAAYDCVSYCAEGCRNYVDVRGQVGGYISGLVGFCVLPDVIYTVGAAGKVVTVGVEGLLCVVGKVVKSVLSTFDCGCA